MMSRGSGNSVACVLCFVSGTLIAAAVTAAARFVPYDDARPLIAALASALPDELRDLTAAQAPTLWPGWIQAHDAAIRARLNQGDEDTIVNWLLFGTTFTARPRVLFDTSPSSPTSRQNESSSLALLIGGRRDDLLRAITSPGSDERRLFARRLLERKGFSFNTAAGVERVRSYLLEAVVRVVREQEELYRELGAARQPGNATAELAARSQLFHRRGLSLDTSLFPNFAVEQSLFEMHSRGLLEPGKIRRVGIVGPGLDFADKDSGFDFYPQQTVQPFAVLNTLGKLQQGPGPRQLEIVVLDISPRVIDHITRARERASRGDSYLLHLPLASDREWTQAARSYWRTFGDHIGSAETVAVPSAARKRAEVRAVRVGNPAVRLISLEDVNIVTQRMHEGSFDLLIATNVFVYYDVFEQALALANIGAMLNPGGFLLSNNALLELPALGLRSVGYLTTQYSDRPDDGDHVIWYQRTPN